MARLDPLEDAYDDVSALAALPHLVWIADPDGRIVYLNDLFKSYTGTDESTYTTLGRKGVVHEDDVERTTAAWRRALETREAYDIEYRLRNAETGRFRWFVARAVPAFDANGRLVRWVGTATDVDGQHRNSESLRFIVHAAATLASLDNEPALCDALARIAVESYADWTFVITRSPEGTYTIPSVAHRDPSLLRDVEDYIRRYPVDQNGAAVLAIEKNEPHLVPLVDRAAMETTARDEEHLELMRRVHLHSAMVVPLSTGEAPALGGLIICSSESERVYTQDDLNVALAVGRYAANALQKARALEREREISTALRFSARASELLSGSWDREEALDRMLQLATSSVVDVAYMWRVEEDGSVRMAAASARRSQHQHILDDFLTDRPLHRPGEELIKSRFAGEPYVIDPFSGESLDRFFYSYAIARFNELGIGAFLSLPLRVGGAPAGSLVFARTGNAHFRADEIDVFKDLARRVNVAVEQRELLRRERRIARELQQALLPQAEMLPKVPGITFDALYQPSLADADIGGDWYDALRTPSGNIVISVGDVTGRGLSAAGAMGKLRQSLSAIALYESDPARILDALDFLLKRRSVETIATAFVGIISPDGKTMRYATAGHPYPLLRCDGKVLPLVAEGLPIGLRQYSTGKSETIELAGAEMLVLYTDGLIESTRDILEGERVLRSVLESDAIVFSHSPALLLRDACLPNGSPDDAAILTLTFTLERHWSFDAENARAAQDARNDFVTHLREHAADGDFEAAEIIFGELIGNVVRHAPGPIDVLVEWTGESPVLHVTDRGPGFTRRPSLPDDPLKESGRGLYIVETLARSLRFERVPGYGTHIAVELPIVRSAR